MKNQSQQEQSDSIVTDVQLSKSKTPDQFKDQDRALQLEHVTDQNTEAVPIKAANHKIIKFVKMTQPRKTSRSMKSNTLSIYTDSGKIKSGNRIRKQQIKKGKKWTNREEAKYREALKLYGPKRTKILQHIGKTKTKIQVANRIKRDRARGLIPQVQKSEIIEIPKRLSPDQISFVTIKAQNNFINTQYRFSTSPQKPPFGQFFASIKAYLQAEPMDWKSIGEIVGKSPEVLEKSYNTQLNYQLKMVCEKNKNATSEQIEAEDSESSAGEGQHCQDLAADQDIDSVSCCEQEYNSQNEQRSNSCEQDAEDTMLFESRASGEDVGQSVEEDAAEEVVESEVNESFQQLMDEANNSGQEHEFGTLETGHATAFGTLENEKNVVQTTFPSLAFSAEQFRNLRKELVTAFISQQFNRMRSKRNNLSLKSGTFAARMTACFASEPADWAAMEKIAGIKSSDCERAWNEFLQMRLAKLKQQAEAYLEERRNEPVRAESQQAKASFDYLMEEANNEEVQFENTNSTDEFQKKKSGEHWSNQEMLKFEEGYRLYGSSKKKIFEHMGGIRSLCAIKHKLRLRKFCRTQKDIDKEDINKGISELLKSQVQAIAASIELPMKTEQMTQTDEEPVKGKRGQIWTLEAIAKFEEGVRYFGHNCQQLYNFIGKVVTKEAVMDRILELKELGKSQCQQKDEILPEDGNRTDQKSKSSSQKWTDRETALFEEGIKLFGTKGHSDLRKVQQHMGKTRSIGAISHKLQDKQVKFEQRVKHELMKQVDSLRGIETTDEMPNKKNPNVQVWRESEEAKFEEGLKLFGPNCHLIHEHMGGIRSFRAIQHQLQNKRKKANVELNFLKELEGIDDPKVQSFLQERNKTAEKISSLRKKRSERETAQVLRWGQKIKKQEENPQAIQGLQQVKAIPMPELDWTPAEIAKFEEGLILYGKSTLRIWAHMGKTRTAEAVNNRIYTPELKQSSNQSSKWTGQEVTLFEQAIELYGTDSRKIWDFMGRTRTRHAISHRINDQKIKVKNDMDIVTQIGQLGWEKVSQLIKIAYPDQACSKNSGQIERKEQSQLVKESEVVSDLNITQSEVSQNE